MLKYSFPLFLSLALAGCGATNTPSRATPLTDTPPAVSAVPTPVLAPVPQFTTYSGLNWTMQAPTSFSKDQADDFNLQLHNVDPKIIVVMKATPFKSIFGLYVLSTLKELQTAGYTIDVLKNSNWNGKQSVYMEVSQANIKILSWSAMVNEAVYDFGCGGLSNTEAVFRPICTDMATSFKISTK